jgi:hypothetical protein
MTAARRLAAILAADVVGYSRLMGQDEAGTAKAVREGHEASTPIVAGHGGRIVKTTGDGVLMEFPSVVVAVECAIAIQKLMTERNAETPEDKRILYRIGVNLGDVLVEATTLLATASISQRDSKASASQGVFMFQAPPTTMFAGVSTPPSPISARKTSGTSLGRCGSTRSKGAEIEPRTQ